MSNIHILALAMAAAVSFSGTAIAQSSTPMADMADMADMPGMSKAAPTDRGTVAAATSDLSEGEIRKVDKDNRRLTIRHGPLRNLDMPGMTMVFGVSEDAMLDTAEVGARVRFQAEKINGKLVVTRLETAD